MYKRTFNFIMMSANSLEIHEEQFYIRHVTQNLDVDFLPQAVLLPFTVSFSIF